MTLATLPQTIRQGAYDLRVPPLLGCQWAAQGGVFVGGMSSPDGDPLRDYYIVLATHTRMSRASQGREIIPDLEQGRMSWPEAMVWAAGCTAVLEDDGALEHFTLPSLEELKVLWRGVRELLTDEPYWSAQPLSPGAAEILTLDFSDGFAYPYSASDTLRACAVRRVPMRERAVRQSPVSSVSTN